jgi:hypothetical protein
MKASPRQLAQRASRWAKEQQPFIHWLERVYGEYVTLAVANPTSKVATSSIKWRDVNGLPETTKIDEHHVERIQVTRPILLDLAVFGPTTPDSQLQWLTLTLPNQQTNLPIVSGMVTVKPPSVQLETLYPLWNLGDVMMGIPSVVPQKNRTSIELRKMFGRWELFIRCNGLSGSGNLPKTIESITQLQGIESISILQPKNKSIATISPSQQNVPDGMEIYRTVQGSSWTVRAVLPQSWISNGILSFSAVRTHGDSPRVETAPLPCVPWNINPEPIILDLSEWDTVDRFPNPRH